MNTFRNYNDNSTVERTYKLMLINHTIEYLNDIRSDYYSLQPTKYSIWDIINRLEQIVDDSDPDTTLPQIIHAHQTASAIKEQFLESDYNIKDIEIRKLFTDNEWSNIPDSYKKIYNTSIRNLYRHIDNWDWFILVGFIHDLGKIMLLKEFGHLEQWSVVGDTFPLGYKLDTNYNFYNKNYHKNNPDLNINTYLDKCGFKNILFCWSHDEYIAKCLEISSSLPEEAIYIIRYHSFYSWHTPSNHKFGYANLASCYDWYMLPLLKIFQKSDLYSKSSSIPDLEEIKDIYNRLINKYLPNGDIYLYHRFIG